MPVPVTVAVAVTVAVVAVPVAVSVVAVVFPVTVGFAVAIAVAGIAFSGGGDDGSGRCRYACSCSRARACCPGAAAAAAGIVRIAQSRTVSDTRRRRSFAGDPNRILVRSTPRRARHPCRSVGESVGSLLEVQPHLAERGRDPRHTWFCRSTARRPPQRRGTRFDATRLAERLAQLPVGGLARCREPRFRNRDPFNRRSAGLALLDRIEGA